MIRDTVFSLSFDNHAAHLVGHGELMDAIIAGLRARRASNFSVEGRSAADRLIAALLLRRLRDVPSPGRLLHREGDAPPLVAHSVS